MKCNKDTLYKYNVIKVVHVGGGVTDVNLFLPVLHILDCII